MSPGDFDNDREKLLHSISNTLKYEGTNSDASGDTPLLFAAIQFCSLCSIRINLFSNRPDTELIIQVLVVVIKQNPIESYKSGAFRLLEQAILIVKSDPSSGPSCLKKAGVLGALTPIWESDRLGTEIQEVARRILKILF